MPTAPSKRLRDLVPTRRWAAGCALAWPLFGCGDRGGAADTGTTAQAESSTTEESSEAGSGSSGETSGGPKLDVGPDTDGPGDCKVVDDMDAPPPCEEQAPPDSFEPDLQWTWTGPGAEIESIVSPLVANLTDDNDDGEIDLCDSPDVVVIAYEDLPVYNGGYGAHLYVLDGATGEVSSKFDTIVEWSATPAIGDIDDDGLPEIVTSTSLQVVDGQVIQPKLIAFEHDGTVKWEADWDWQEISSYGDSLALADLDNDGDVEIIVENFVASHEGELLWHASDETAYWTSTAAADLDDDGDLEVVLGNAAYHHDGTPLWQQPQLDAGFPQIADLDDDPEPEVLVTSQEGIHLLDHDGTIQYQNQKPTGDMVTLFTWNRPATVHDFDGDGLAEYALSSANHYAVYQPDAAIHWMADVLDYSGTAAGTAFDFLGDGTAEAMYADERTMFIFDAAGQIYLSSPRTSGTCTEYPVVADIDNDGSAEIVVVSNDVFETYMVPQSPTVQVIRDAQDRWIGSRRIWNQHTYHVTNVREDATIPQFEPPSWEHLNTYRTNAQLEGGSVCVPEG